jgi:DNA adenine methylase
MKTPLPYYGGKQQLVSIIIPYITDHDIYIEPFAGAASVFWSKKRSKVEIINDLNGEIVNFYRVIRSDFEKLHAEICSTPLSRRLHLDARVIYKNPHLFSEIKRAWAVWVLATQSLNSNLDTIWHKSHDKKCVDYKERFNQALVDRLDSVYIECCNALELIQKHDTERSFFYIDPPYVGSDQGHYKGYTQDDFNSLLTLLESIKGNFILSSYRNDSLDTYTKHNGWDTIELKMIAPASALADKRKTKIEVITANFKLTTAELDFQTEEL